MKALILAGGYGTRLSEETDIRPKPMVEVGGKPILWHIMKTYSYHGINDFIISLILWIDKNSEKRIKVLGPMSRPCLVSLRMIVGQLKLDRWNKIIGIEFIKDRTRGKIEIWMPWIQFRRKKNRKTELNASSCA